MPLLPERLLPLFGSHRSPLAAATASPRGCSLPRSSWRSCVWRESGRSQDGPWSFLAMMYQLGFDLQAVPPTFASNRSGAGTHWVAQTSFFSCSDKSPAKESMPSGSSQIRPSATSMCERRSVFGKLMVASGTSHRRPVQMRRCRPARRRDRRFRRP